VDDGPPSRLLSAPTHFGLHGVTVDGGALARANRIDLTLTPASGEAVSESIELFD
jgi:hypothetical protein